MSEINALERQGIIISHKLPFLEALLTPKVLKTYKVLQPIKTELKNISVETDTLYLILNIE